MTSGQAGPVLQRSDLKCEREEPAFDPRNPSKKLGVVPHTNNSRVLEAAEDKRVPDSMASQSS